MAASGVYAATAARSARPIPEACLMDPNGRLYDGLLSFPGRRDGGSALFLPLSLSLYAGRRSRPAPHMPFRWRMRTLMAPVPHRSSLPARGQRPARARQSPAAGESGPRCWRSGSGRPARGTERGRSPPTPAAWPHGRRSHSREGQGILHVMHGHLRSLYRLVSGLENQMRPLAPGAATRADQQQQENERHQRIPRATAAGAQWTCPPGAGIKRPLSGGLHIPRPRHPDPPPLLLPPDTISPLLGSP